MKIGNNNNKSRLEELKGFDFGNARVPSQEKKTPPKAYPKDNTNLSKTAKAERPNLNTLMLIGNTDIRSVSRSNSSRADDLNEKQLSQIRSTSDFKNLGHTENAYGVRVPDKVYQDFPNLRVLDGVLKVQDYDNPGVKQLVGQLAKFPTNVLSELKREGLREIEVANLTTPDMGDNDSLRGTKPRNWPAGKTWEDVPGAYNPNNKTVVAGSAAAHGSKSLLAHETGHAIGDILGFDNSRELRDAHNRLYNKIDPYLKGEGAPGNEAGRQELLAEGIATYLEKGEQAAVNTFDREFVDFIKYKVLNAGN